mgnify:FL=1
MARITNIANWYFERVVFPGQRLVFESEPQGILEIHSDMMASAILSDTIPCTKLALQAINTRNAGQESKNESSVDLNQDDSSNQENIAPSFNVAV